METASGTSQNVSPRARWAVGDVIEPAETWSDGDTVACPWCRKPVGPMRLMDWLQTDRMEKRCGHCDRPITILCVVKATYRCMAR